MTDENADRSPFSEWIRDSFRRLMRSLGVLDLQFNLTPDDRSRLLWASVLPCVVAAANLIALGIEVNWDTYSIAGINVYGSDMPDFWQRVFAASGVLKALGELATAAMFIAGVARVSRGVGTWSMVIALALFSFAALLAAGGAVALLAFGLNDEKLRDYHVYEWDFWASTAAILAIGYAFLAYRGLAVSTYRPREVVRRQRSAARRDETVSPDRQLDGGGLPREAADD